MATTEQAVSEPITPKKVSGYPLPFSLLLLGLLPVGYLAAALGLTAVLPIGALTYRAIIGFGLALLPALLAFRASAAMKRRRLPGWVRSMVALLIVITGYAAVVGGLFEWRELRPPHLVATADHLLRTFVSGETMPALTVVEPQPPLSSIYDRQTEGLASEIAQRLVKETGEGVPSIEVWDVKKQKLLYRFRGDRTRVKRVRFLDERRFLGVLATGEVNVFDAESGDVLKRLAPKSPLFGVRTRTSTSAVLVTGKDDTGATRFLLFDADTGEATSEVAPQRDVTAYGITTDLQRLVTIEKTKRNKHVLVVRHLPTAALEATIPEATLPRKWASKVDKIIMLPDGKTALLLIEKRGRLWNLETKKEEKFALADIKIFRYGVAPNAATYFHRRTDAADTRATGLYRMTDGEKLVEIETRGQPPRAFFTPDGRYVLIDTAVFRASDGRPAGGLAPQTFTQKKGRWMKPAGDTLLEPKSDELLIVRHRETRKILAHLPRRGERKGALSSDGSFYAVPVRLPYADDQKALEMLSVWTPPPVQ